MMVDDTCGLSATIPRDSDPIATYRSNRNFPDRITSAGLTGGLIPMAPPESLSPSGVALACVLRNATSDNDVVSTAAPDSISNEEETSYVAFRNWISSGSPDKMKPELAQLLYPVFTHLYLQLVLKGNKSEAQQFHAKHHGTFVGNAEFARFVYLLTSILEPDDLTRDEIASAFYNSKYGVTLSGETFGHLSRYLEASSNSVQTGDDHLKHPLTVARIFRAKIDLRIAPEPPTGSCSKSESTNQIRISKEEMRVERESAQAAESLSKSVNEEKLKVIECRQGRRALSPPLNLPLQNIQRKRRNLLYLHL